MASLVRQSLRVARTPPAPNAGRVLLAVCIAPQSGLSLLVYLFDGTWPWVVFIALFHPEFWQLGVPAFFVLYFVAWLRPTAWASMFVGGVIAALPYGAIVVLLLMLREKLSSLDLLIVARCGAAGCFAGFLFWLIAVASLRRRSWNALHPT
jgi:hypothetical protein